MEIMFDITDFMRRVGVYSTLNAAAEKAAACDLGGCFYKLREAILWLPENPELSAWIGRTAARLADVLADAARELVEPELAARVLEGDLRNLGPGAEAVCAHVAQVLRETAGPAPSQVFRA